MPQATPSASGNSSAEFHAKLKSIQERLYERLLCPIHSEGNTEDYTRKVYCYVDRDRHNTHYLLTYQHVAYWALEIVSELLLSIYNIQ